MEGTGKSPLFMSMTTHIKKKIEKFVEEELGNSSLFLVDVYVSNNARKVEVILDGDQGINIDQCGSLSKKLGAYLEEDEDLSRSYQLYVASPGVDRPITNWRQYRSRIGRDFKFVLVNGANLRGKLKEVIGDSQLIIDAEIKEKGKKKTIIVEQKLEKDQIAESQVQVSFK